MVDQALGSKGDVPAAGARDVHGQGPESLGYGSGIPAGQDGEQRAKQAIEGAIWLHAGGQRDRSPEEPRVEERPIVATEPLLLVPGEGGEPLTGPAVRGHLDGPEDEALRDDVGGSEEACLFEQPRLVDQGPQ